MSRTPCALRIGLPLFMKPTEICRSGVGPAEHVAEADVPEGFGVVGALEPLPGAQPNRRSCAASEIATTAGCLILRSTEIA